ncbi:probable receptor-like protein kinase At4g10390 [Syzygium oleosum]|uniref:probable receptor-like protein kinase At4g10390 n=1 Tax=Syzygium oleosum TaxID=219896 RepID=UPI0024BAE9D7|nr:probable receptor-like protein kinase At4g10390 [Syzygium oleosum]
MGIVKFLRSKLLNRRRGGSQRAAAVHVDGGESCSGRCGDVAEVAGAAVKRLGWGEIEMITACFAEVAGEGGFSTVYMGRFPGCGGGSAAAAAAVKVHCGGGERLSLAFKQELDVLLRLKHENIVRLLGYCDDADQGALIFEYVSGGTLHEHLHGRGSSNKSSALPWKSRVKIAFQLAHAIEYLHDRCTLHVIHGDIKSSNVLLDGDSDCKLCDFGSAKMGFSSMVPPPSSSPSSPYVRRKNIIMGSLGYTDPLYLRTGIASKKNDIYSFGIVVLELVTGLEAFRSDKGQVLASMAAHMTKNVDRMDAGEVMNMVDPKLRGDFDAEEARALIKVARSCLDESTLVRPTASRVVKMMK